MDQSENLLCDIYKILGLSMEFIGPETQKAVHNFAFSDENFDNCLIKAMGMVKLACCTTNTNLGYLAKDIGNSIEITCQELIDGLYDDYIVIDPYQGGAGTSLNMNVNEVLAYFASKKVDGLIVNPLQHVNLHQSTNDVFPTAVKIAVLYRLKELETKTAELQASLQVKEQEFANVIKLGRTELMDAVPMTLGMEFGAYAEAISRDRWRVFKCRERIKTVNLGGTAIGTGLGAPRQYILRVNEELKNICGLAVSRSENLIDATQNLDSFAEVSGILKAMAVNLLKISNDLRLLNSGPNGGLSEIELPELQKGSSIMPGKVNPVMPEAISQIALQVMSNDSLIGLAAGLGQLELNHYLPLLAHNILKSIKLLSKASSLFSEKCIKGIKPRINNCRNNVINSTSLATYLIPLFGYDKVEEIIKKATLTDQSIKQIILLEELLTEEEFNELLKPQRMYKLGFSEEDYRK